VALAAVDQALLELMPNTSWNLLEAMLQRRSWGVETSTAQMEIIGRRHYGKQGRARRRRRRAQRRRASCSTPAAVEPAVQLDANGQAKVTVPLNDALTTFKIVAVADAAPACLAPAAPASAPRKTCRSSAACRRWCARATSSAPRSRCATPPRRR
jgi:uncharacterized protein YfaS (alpha-2-macroglobulin family)